MRQLKGLDLSVVIMMDFSPEILQVFWNKLQPLSRNLEWCGITESQGESILSALSLCSSLGPSVCGNVLSGHPGEASESHH